ncbi:DUF421 domain-containing protein [Rhodohalobacter sp. 614A]|uniref:DUF421 domain-containing protein n=1 Tax=Rhodohalobacter sp. 614A TaxID=2908649 RepID=UPI001F377EA0|nr:YetF domain-containing protein [Rhodohalobacter sp. 614A]
MDSSWIVTTFSSVIMVVISTFGIYFALILFTRIAGVRTFSKMSSFDFAVTVAIGSLIASTVLTKNPPLFQSIAAMGTLFIIQITIAGFRETSLVRNVVDNKPILLMKGTRMLEGNMRKAKVTRNDLLGKLREANVTQFNQIKAVVMETTGDISVLHHNDEAHELEMGLLDDVRK